MPELPEVETIVKGLSELITGNVINNIIIREPKIIAFPDAKDFKKSLCGKTIKAINRRGKYILIRIEDDKTLVIHLRMTGKLLVKPHELQYDTHTHIIFELSNKMDIRFHNVRKFGRMYLIENGAYQNAGGLAKLGPEPLSNKFTLDKFKGLFKSRSANIKSLLLNQSFIAGMGNIYTDEALFIAGISHDRNADTLTDSEKEKLYRSIRKVLKNGIKYGGTSFSDYLNAIGEKGDFQKELKVYQQTGEKCPECGETIEKKRVAGRGTHYCPNCQH